MQQELNLNEDVDMEKEQKSKDRTGVSTYPFSTALPQKKDYTHGDISVINRKRKRAFDTEWYFMKPNKIADVQNKEEFKDYAVVNDVYNIMEGIKRDFISAKMEARKAPGGKAPTISEFLSSEVEGDDKQKYLYRFLQSTALEKNMVSTANFGIKTNFPRFAVVTLGANAVSNDELFLVSLYHLASGIKTIKKKYVADIANDEFVTSDQPTTGNKILYFDRRGIQSQSTVESFEAYAKCASELNYVKTSTCDYNTKFYSLQPSDYNISESVHIVDFDYAGTRFWGLWSAGTVAIAPKQELIKYFRLIPDQTTKTVSAALDPKVETLAQGRVKVFTQDRKQTELTTNIFTSNGVVNFKGENKTTTRSVVHMKSRATNIIQTDIKFTDPKTVEKFTYVLKLTTRPGLLLEKNHSVSDPKVLLEAEDVWTILNVNEFPLWLYLVATPETAAKVFESVHELNVLRPEISILAKTYRTLVSVLKKLVRFRAQKLSVLKALKAYDSIKLLSAYCNLITQNVITVEAMKSLKKIFTILNSPLTINFLNIDWLSLQSALDVFFVTLVGTPGDDMTKADTLLEFFVETARKVSPDIYVPLDFTGYSLDNLQAVLLSAKQQISAVSIQNEELGLTMEDLNRLHNTVNAYIVDLDKQIKNYDDARMDLLENPGQIRWKEEYDKKMREIEAELGRAVVAVARMRADARLIEEKLKEKAGIDFNGLQAFMNSLSNRTRPLVNGILLQKTEYVPENVIEIPENSTSAVSKAKSRWGGVSLGKRSEKRKNVIRFPVNTGVSEEAK